MSITRVVRGWLSSKGLSSIVLLCLCGSATPLVAGEPNSVEYLNSGKVLPINLPFSEAVRVDDTLYLSGQVGIVPGTMNLAEGGLDGESRQAMENIKTTLEAHGYSMQDLVKCTVMLADISQWATFNDVYKTYFDQPYPARSAFGANGLAIGAQVEIECIAVRNPQRVKSDSREAVENIAKAYIAATYEGDSDKLRELFADSAVMNGYLAGQLTVGTPEPFFQQMESKPSLKSVGAPYTANIDHVHVAGSAASVTISETGFGDKNFINYMHLIRIDGKWLIVSKTFESS